MAPRICIRRSRAEIYNNIKYDIQPHGQAQPTADIKYWDEDWRQNKHKEKQETIYTRKYNKYRRINIIL